MTITDYLNLNLARRWQMHLEQERTIKYLQRELDELLKRVDNPNSPVIESSSIMTTEAVKANPPESKNFMAKMRFSKGTIVHVCGWPLALTEEMVAETNAGNVISISNAIRERGTTSNA